MDLFTKYQSLLIAFANQHKGKDIFNATEEIIKVTPNSFTELLGFEKKRPVKRTTIFASNWIEKKLGLALSDIDLIQYELENRKHAQSLFTKFAYKEKGMPFILHSDTFNAIDNRSALQQYQAVGAWTVAHAAVTGTDAVTNNGSNLRWIVALYDGTNVNIRRACMIYDTSSITSGDVVSALQEKIFIDSVNNPRTNSLVFTAYTGGVTTSPSTLDYDNFGSTTSPTEFASRLAFSSMTTTAYNTITMNSSAYSSINTGAGAFSALGHRTNEDADNSQPANATEANFFGDWGSGNPAQIIVTHAASTNKKVSFKTLLGIGQA